MVKQPISNLSLDELLPDSLTSTICVNIEKGTKIWVVTGMLVQYLESFTDSVVVRDKDKPVGIAGGKHVIQKLVDNPTSDLFDNTNVEDIMTTKFIKISKRTKLRELLDFWKQTRIAFAIIPNEFSDYSELSARKLLEIGMRCKTEISEDLSISEVSKLLYKMEHPYIVYGKRVVSPWDICLCLLSDKLTEYE